jgi:predicted Zn-dependent peptidase
MAHLFEHLMFAGTSRLAKGEHLRLVQSVGGNSNATTSTDWTCYYQVVPSDALELVLWLEAERLRGMPEAMTEEKVQTEVQVVINERLTTIENLPYGNATELIAGSMWPDGHPYQHVPIGRSADLSAVSKPDVLEFFARHYCPGNATLGLAGDFDLSEALPLLERHLGRVAGGSGYRTDPPPPAVRLTERVQISQPGPGTPRLFIGVLLPPVGSADYEACRVTASALAGGGAGGWLVQALGREQGMVSDVKVRFMAQAHGSSLAVIELIPQADVDLNALEEAYRVALLRLADRGLEPAELSRAIAMHTSARLARADRVGGLADDLSLSATIGDDCTSFLRTLEAVQSMRVPDASEFCRRFSGADGAVVLQYLTSARRSS